jgi:hypothetical protein
VSESAWGNQIFGGVTGAPGTLQDVLINDDLGPLPTVHSILLFHDVVTAPSGNLAYHAQITIGAGAVSTSFCCDWRGQFSVVCSRVAVRARTFQPRIVAVAADPLERHRHGAILGWGQLHGSAPLSFTDADLIFSPLDDVSWVQTIAVPKFARRFFPRFSKGIGPGSGVPATLGWSAEIESFTLGLTRPGSVAANFSQMHGVSAAIARDGIDVSDADYVTVTAALGLGLQSGYYLTPVFELAL